MPRPIPSPIRRTPPPSLLAPLALSGANPGALTARIHVPATLPQRPALVVVLHGCTQTAAGYDNGAGWSALAEAHGFLLLFPEQRRANNGNLCFNWFTSGDVTRDRGEVASIAAMVAQMTAEHDVDPARIFVTGLSAGGAMTAAMLATYPELFAAGAVIAGLPFGCAGSVGEALERMRVGPMLTDAMLGDRVRAASPHRGAWPRLSVWHGTADRTVNPANGAALVRQWADLHGLPATPTRTDDVAGHPRRSWVAGDGTVLIEDHLIAGMGHGTPLACGEGADRGGTAGAYMLDVGISSSHAIARFFGLLDAAAKPVSAPQPEPAADRIPERAPARAPLADPVPRRLEPVGRTARQPSTVQGIIEGALRSAGLMK